MTPESIVISRAFRLCRYAGQTRLIQIEIDAMASYSGVPRVALLSPALLA